MIVIIFGFVKFAHPYPFEVQSNHSTFYLIDAACLLVFGKHPKVVMVTVDIHNPRNFAGEIVRLIQQATDPESRDNLVNEL